MRVTIIHTINYDVRVHAADCRDIPKDLKRRDYLSSWTIEADTEQQVANDAWSDFVGESMTEKQAMEYCHFLPCCKELT